MKFTHDGVTYEAEQGERNDFDDEVEVRERHWHPRAGDVVLDVGAAIGSYTLPALALGAEVYAFCPDMRDNRRLKANLALNPGFIDRCIVFDVGLYSEPGFLTENAAHDRYIFTPVSQEEPKPVWLRVAPLDLYAHLWPTRIDWLKIDVEGNEVHVLRGAEQTIRKHRPKLLVECHQFMDRTLVDQVFHFVNGLGLGYSYEGQSYHSVFHSFFEVKP